MLDMEMTMIELDEFLAYSFWHDWGKYLTEDAKITQNTSLERYQTVIGHISMMGGFDYDDPEMDCQDQVYFEYFKNKGYFP
jgi:hypothetical protein